jgi:hypothetical protein
MSNVLLPHPTNGTSYFGFIPESKSRGIVIPPGLIVLKQGKYRDPGGFGAAHIWGKHSAELIREGYQTADKVSTYVADIVHPGAPILFEYGSIAGTKVTIVKSTLGLAILRYEDIAGGRYSVTTAYAQKNAHGTRIGTVGTWKIS